MAGSSTSAPVRPATATVRGLGREYAVPDTAGHGPEGKACDGHLLGQRLRRHRAERERARRPLPEGGRADAGRGERSGKLSHRQACLSIATGGLFRPGPEAGRRGRGGKLFQKRAHRRVARDLFGKRIPRRFPVRLRIRQFQQLSEQPPLDLARDIGDEHLAAPAQSAGGRYESAALDEPRGPLQDQIGTGKRQIDGRPQQVPPESQAMKFERALQAEIALHETGRHVPAAPDIADDGAAHRRIGLLRPEIRRDFTHGPIMGRPGGRGETQGPRPSGVRACG